MRSIWPIVATIVVVAGCAAPDLSGDETDTVPPQLYVTGGIVIERPGTEPEICTHMVLESSPPQCGAGAVPLVGWEWDSGDAKLTDLGVTWTEADLRVTGTYDGHALTLTEPPQPAPAPPPATDAGPGTPCPPPPGGWAVPDPSMTGDAGRVAVQRYTLTQPDHAETWFDDAILNVAFTGEVERHERELRTVWGGMLCVSVLDRSRTDLEAIGAELGMGSDPNVLGWVADPVHGRVVVAVLVDDGFSASLTDRYGAGTVTVEPALRPVESPQPG